MSTDTTTRNATLEDLAAVLTERQARSRDIVVPAAKLRSRNGLLVVTGAEPEITVDGVTQVDGTYRPTAVFDEGLSAKLDIPRAYLRRLRDTAPDLFDANVNGWLHGKSVLRSGERDVIRPGDDRKFLVRTLRADEGGEGVARALLSDSFKAIDDFDVLISGLEGLKQAGIENPIVRANLTERRMYLDVVVPQVSALAPVLLTGYRSPFEGPNALPRAGGAGALDGHDFGFGPIKNPIVFAGFRISNSEVGSGAASVTPRLTVLACTNGITITNDQVKYRHSGGKLDQGIVDWSGETYRKTLSLISSETADAVRTFLSKDYLEGQIAEIERKAGRSIDAPEEIVRDVTKSLGFSQAEQAGVLSHFIRGGQPTAGGLLNAVTSYSQTLGSADRAAELDAVALQVLDRI